MLDSLKGSFWPMGRPGNQVQARNVAQQPVAENTDVRDRLSELMGQLDEGFAKSSSREAAKAAEYAATHPARETDRRPQPRAAEAAAQEKEQPAQATVTPTQAAEAPVLVFAPDLKAPKMEQPAQVPVTPTQAAEARILAPAPDLKAPTHVEQPVIQEDVMEDVMSEETSDAMSEETSDALRFAFDQRKAAEALLFEACVLEDRLKDEAQVAAAVRECTIAKEKAERAAAEADQATHVVVQKGDVRTAAQAERTELEELLTARRAEAEAADAKIEEIARALQEAKDRAAQIRSAMSLHQVRAMECADKESAARIEETQAVERLQACKANHDAAEADAAAARERVETLKKSLSAQPGPTGLEAVQALAARIAEQARLVRYSHHIGSESAAA